MTTRSEKTYRDHRRGTSSYSAWIAERPPPSTIASGSIKLKLKTADFRLRTRSRRLTDPTQLAEILFRTTSSLLAAETDGLTRYRQIGVGADLLVDGSMADLPTLFDDDLGRPRRLERALDEIHARLGDDSVRRGRALPGLGARPAAEIAPRAAGRDPE